MVPYYSAPNVNLFHADCRDFLAIHKHELEGQVDAVITDPPFNIGQAYDEHDDDVCASDYEQFFREWVFGISTAIKVGGVVAINVPDALVNLTLNTALSYGLQRIDWVIWHYRFGQCVNSKFISSKTHCLIFRYGGTSHTWNPQLVESDRYSKYNDARTLQTDTPGKRVPFDVWSTENDGPHWSRLVGNNLEKVPNHPNQLPEKYIERLVLSYTNPGDLIFEPFGGTGTVPVVAAALGRRCICVELSQAYCDDIKTRLEKGAVRC